MVLIQFPNGQPNLSPHQKPIDSHRIWLSNDRSKTRTRARSKLLQFSVIYNRPRLIDTSHSNISLGEKNPNR